MKSSLGAYNRKSMLSGQLYC